MRLFLSILLSIICLVSSGQIDLAVQRGHSDEIVNLEFSVNNNYLASMAANQEFVIWDLNREKSINIFTISKIENIDGMKFSDDEKSLLIKTKRTTFDYNIENSLLTEISSSDTNYRNPTYFFDSKSNCEVHINKGVLRKKSNVKFFSEYNIAVPGVKTSFISFDVHPEKNRIIGVAENQKTYVYKYTNGRKVGVVDGHISEVNDIRISSDGKYFATAGMDRSIVVWNMVSLEEETRLSSRIFQKKTVNFSADGNKLFVGDELGYIYQIDLNAAFPAIDVFRPNYQPVNQIVRNKETYFVASSNNHVYETTDLNYNKAAKKYSFRDFAILDLPSIILQEWFNVYQIPFGEITQVDLSPNEKNILYTGVSKFPCITLANRETAKERRFYGEGNDAIWKDADFITDSTFLSYYDSTNVLYLWKFDKKETFFKTDTLPFIIENIEVIDANSLWINAKYDGQFIYNLGTKSTTKINNLKCKKVMLRNDFMVLATQSNAITLYDLKQKKEQGIYVGHTESVTDVNFHPTKLIFASSSNDGTVKLWSMLDKQLLVTIIPFKDDEFVFVTRDNYYLITKGALEEIGFKVNGDYFYPEQFDLRYNRPDIVLAEMGYSSPDLIKAYKKAYKKRLKKMNFNEEQLKGEFHLPSAEILNTSDIPKQTTAREIQLSVLLKDELYKLDRINVWLNDVAVYGTNGLNVRDEKTNQIRKELTVNLSQGRNKIEISVLNQNGAESYKSLVEIDALYEEIPNLFVATVGISKHIQSKYDLEYADKDAIDIANTFKENKFFGAIETFTLTNEQVVKENLHQLKSFLSKAKINDVVILSIAGHGVLNKDFDYFFASHNLDFNNPDINGIPYEAIEKLLDGIPALRKLLFIDTCHSGELDKDEVEEGNGTDSENGDIKFRNAGLSVKNKENPLGLKSTNELMRSLFTDLRRGTGATVISSSGGAELSIEANQYENGLFTYCLLSGLTSGMADLNEDGEIFVSEIQLFVQTEVKRLSNGLQSPTSRLQNNELDYRIW